MTAYSDGGYTTNLTLEDVTGDTAWVVFSYDGQPLDPALRRSRAPSADPPLDDRVAGIPVRVSVQAAKEQEHLGLVPSYKHVRGLMLRAQKHRLIVLVRSGVWDMHQTRNRSVTRRVRAVGPSAFPDGGRAPQIIASPGLG